MSMGRFALLACVIAALHLGCGSSGSDASTGGSGGACTNACAACAGDLCADCAATSDRYRDSYEAALYSCVQDADACSSDTWSSCASQATSTSAPRRSIDDTYRDTCMNKRSDCATSGTNFADDYCLLTSLLAEKWVQQANECVAKACTEVGGCLEAVFK